jgi:hypothetical protein
MGWDAQAERHLQRVNGWDRPTALAYIAEAFAVFDRRSQLNWRLDISWLEDKGVTIPEKLDR